jgi:hypothetical protein
MAIVALSPTLLARSSVAAVPFNPGIGKGDPAECSQTIGSGSIEAAANALANGQVLCVRGGIYAETDRLITIRTSGTAGAPKKIKAYPGERVEIRGAISSRASHHIIEGLFIDASYATSGAAPGGRVNTDQGINWTGGTNIRIDSVEIVNRRPNLDPVLAGTCVYFGGVVGPTSIILENSSIHQCGQLPRVNHEHCVYAAKVSGLTIRNNWIHDCADRSIQLSPDADDVVVVANLVDSDSTAAGILLDRSANGDSIQNNVVNAPNGKPIYTGIQYAGSGNTVTDNCVWDAAAGLSPDVASSGNIVADPHVSGFTVTAAACLAKLPADSPFRP